jgi:DNA-binding NarL/FixJ family response regulator
MTTVIVVEPHALLRFGILQHLTEVLAESQVRGVDYSSLSRQASAESESDLVLLSVALHDNVTVLVQAAQRAYTPKWMLLLSDVATIPSSWGDLPSVVAGYVSRSASPEVLAASIRLVLVGGRCFPSSPRTSNSQVPDLRLASSDSKSGGAVLPIQKFENSLSGVAKKASAAASLANIEAEMLHITPRQYEVLVLLARGYPIKTVSRHLNISIATAKAHTETLYQRLDAHNRNQAVYTAVSRGATLGWQQLESYGANEPLHGATAA